MSALVEIGSTETVGDVEEIETMCQHANSMRATLADLERRTMSGNPLAHEYLRQLCNSHCEYLPQSGGIGWLLRKSHDESSFFRRALARFYMQSGEDLDVSLREHVMPLVILIAEGGLQAHFDELGQH